jgi:SAM-dependent methyltransferase
MTAPVAMFGAALRRAARGDGASLTLLDRRGAPIRLYDAGVWSAEQRAGDGSLVDRCRPYTIDLGCGPGRLTAALSIAGRPVLGIDISPQAVRFARMRGVPALLADALGPLPDEGRWHSALLADGNIGIGGDPVRLLHRTRRLVRPGGRLLVEVDPPGHGSWQGDVALSDGRRVSDAFAWAFVGADQIAAIAAAAGLRVLESWTEAGRWFVDLRD